MMAMIIYLAYFTLQLLKSGLLVGDIHFDRNFESKITCVCVPFIRFLLHLVKNRRHTIMPHISCIEAETLIRCRRTTFSRISLICLQPSNAASITFGR